MIFPTLCEVDLSINNIKDKIYIMFIAVKSLPSYMYNTGDVLGSRMVPNLWSNGAIYSAGKHILELECWYIECNWKKLYDLPYHFNGHLLLPVQSSMLKRN